MTDNAVQLFDSVHGVDGLADIRRITEERIEMISSLKKVRGTKTCALTLDRVGIPKSDWFGTNQMNVKVPRMYGWTYNDIATEQLIINKLPETGSSDFPRGRR